MKYLTLITLFFSVMLMAQVEEDSELFLQMKQLDSVVFEVGFNQCNLSPTEALLTDDFEFYHDIGGIQNKAEFIAAMKKNICGNPKTNLTRKLIKGSMEVFPLSANNELYGAIQRGEHEFYRQADGQENKKTGYAKFTSYWELQNNEWKLKRTFSFDHRAAH
ncbi:nuclear transport factor 2 family protein [Rasiella rasia]|uniref:Nuclear transport factor 2 family protein n=1 Tax=Rasiella rasia TaxID=2744027 RepID=A0A6G6GHU8_9FLAO|nr:nuclear transport factor 2 family protein [Rasiella rasia]QIE58104.1 nuclear transport factor 2 family protein [Rasiella rasia]